MPKLFWSRITDDDYSSCPSTTGAYFPKTNEIYVERRDDAPMSEVARTLAHEIAHWRAQGSDVNWKSSGALKELKEEVDTWAYVKEHSWEYDAEKVREDLQAYIDFWHGAPELPEDEEREVRRYAWKRLGLRLRKGED